MDNIDDDADRDFCWTPGASLPHTTSSPPLLFTPPMTNKRMTVAPSRTFAGRFPPLESPELDHGELGGTSQTGTYDSQHLTPQRPYTRKQPSRVENPAIMLQREEENLDYVGYENDNVCNMLGAVLKSQKQLQEQMGKILQRVSVLENTPESSSSSSDNSRKRKRRLPGELCVSYYIDAGKS